MVSVIWAVPPSVRRSGTRRRASQLGYWLAGGLVAAVCIGAVTADRAQPAACVPYFGGPRAAASPGGLGPGVTGPAGNPVVNADHDDLRYAVPGEPGRAGTAIASSRPAVAGDSHIGAAPSAGARETAATGGDVFWYAVAHIAGAAAVFLARAGADTALILITAVRRSRRRRAARSDLEVSGDDGQACRCSPAAAK